MYRIGKKTKIRGTHDLWLEPYDGTAVNILRKVSEPVRDGSRIVIENFQPAVSIGPNELPAVALALIKAGKDVYDWTDAEIAALVGAREMAGRQA